jgi:uncharacterized protein YndB with AHSA1/START domain
MKDHATFIKPSTVRLERLLPGPVERVWAYLTESKKRASWLAAGEFDLRLGGRIELIFENDKLSDEPVPAGAQGAGRKKFEGKITRLEPLRALGYTWNWDGRDSEVLYELAPKGKEVLLTIQHRMPDDRELCIAVGGGWPTHVGILADQLNGVKPRPFWSTHAKLMKDFAAYVMTLG